MGIISSAGRNKRNGDTLRYRALIITFGSIKDKILYGVSEFTIERKQVVPVEIKETTKEALKNFLHSNNLHGAELEAIEKKMEIRKIPCDEKRAVETFSADVILKLP